MSTYDDWKLRAPEDEPGYATNQGIESCDRIGCGQPAEYTVREHGGTAYLCADHAAEFDEVPVGGSSGCAGGCPGNAAEPPSEELTK